jgi:hypothetical protein
MKEKDSQRDEKQSNNQLINHCGKKQNLRDTKQKHLNYNTTLYHRQLYLHHVQQNTMWAL